MKIGFYGENFIDEATAAASVAATRGIMVGGALGHVFAMCVAGEGGCTIADGKTVTLTATQSDTVDGTYSALGSHTRTISGDTTFAEGEVIAEIGFPSYVKDYAKVAFASNDSAISGKVKIIPYTVG
jgi:hypothetical protein